MSRIKYQTIGGVVSVPASHFENISGLVEKVIFHNPENGFGVLKIQVKGKKDLVTLIGHLPAIKVGEFIQADGAWVQDRQHGLQFKAEFLKVTAPTTLEGIEKYLGSGLIKGIGPVHAKKLLGTFKEELFKVIEENPQQLQSVSGIGPARLAKIIKNLS